MGHLDLLASGDHMLGGKYLEENSL